ncbi:MAG: hypothetical protein KC475_01275 [Cyanobacteria bacterium HKST-UBA03]|nr:hypothetical protein [Cyanobacteria bacterium HKST-UBA03]
MFQSPVSPAAASVAIPGYPSMARPMPQPKPAYIPFSPTGPVAQPDPPFKLDGIRVADPELIESLYILSKTENLPRDEAYLRSLGVNIMFHNGRQAIDVLRKRGVSIIFSDMGDSTAHAEWVSDMNLIKINQRYKDDRSLPTLYALSEAIFHEAGHAAHRGDARSSIQEDVDCLALNAMAYRAHVAQTPAYPYFRPKGRLKPLFDNGVARYAQLFFNWDPYNPPTYQGSDPTLENLVHRIADKYGDLPPENPDHPIPILPYGHPLALRICQELQRRFAEQSETMAPINNR